MFASISVYFTIFSYSQLFFDPFSIFPLFTFCNVIMAGESVHTATKGRRASVVSIANNHCKAKGHVQSVTDKE